VVCIY